MVNNNNDHDDVNGPEHMLLAMFLAMHSGDYCKCENVKKTQDKKRTYTYLVSLYTSCIIFINLYTTFSVYGSTKIINLVRQKFHHLLGH